MGIKDALEAVMTRVCELKEMLINFNTKPKSLCVNLDELLVDLKMSWEALEVPIPYYF